MAITSSLRKTAITVQPIIKVGTEGQYLKMPYEVLLHLWNISIYYLNNTDITLNNTKTVK